MRGQAVLVEGAGPGRKSGARMQLWGDNVIHWARITTRVDKREALAKESSLSKCFESKEHWTKPSRKEAVELELRPDQHGGAQKAWNGAETSSHKRLRSSPNLSVQSAKDVPLLHGQFSLSLHTLQRGCHGLDTTNTGPMPFLQKGMITCQGVETALQGTHLSSLLILKSPQFTLQLTNSGGGSTGRLRVRGDITRSKERRPKGGRTLAPKEDREEISSAGFATVGGGVPSDLLGNYNSRELSRGDPSLFRGGRDPLG
ncbi:hypothetical protein LIER_42744 [Lithospermum erythrorhizon]|uniref:Uncharacterized protein n=1 Tax=Lithospermum erythrorhizon TaxID=34254 RepID=A0AAV3NVF7_LITER